MPRWRQARRRRWSAQYGRSCGSPSVRLGKRQESLERNSRSTLGPEQLCCQTSLGLSNPLALNDCVTAPGQDSGTAVANIEASAREAPLAIQLCVYVVVDSGHHDAVAVMITVELGEVPPPTAAFALDDHSPTVHRLQHEVALRHQALPKGDDLVRSCRSSEPEVPCSVVGPRRSHRVAVATHDRVRIPRDQRSNGQLVDCGLLDGCHPDLPGADFLLEGATRSGYPTMLGLGSYVRPGRWRPSHDTIGTRHCGESIK